MCVCVNVWVRACLLRTYNFSRIKWNFFFNDMITMYMLWLYSYQWKHYNDVLDSLPLKLRERNFQGYLCIMHNISFDSTRNKQLHKLRSQDHKTASCYNIDDDWMKERATTLLNPIFVHLGNNSECFCRKYTVKCNQRV